MESASGKVRSVQGGVATIVVDRAPVCARCAAGKGCGAGLLTGSDGPVVIDLPLPPGPRLSAGDPVRLSVSSSWILRAALLAYGLPLLTTVAAAAMAWFAGMPGGDLGAAGFSAVGLVSGFVAGRGLLGRSGLCDRLEAEIDSRSHVPVA